MAEWREGGSSGDGGEGKEAKAERAARAYCICGSRAGGREDEISGGIIGGLGRD